jgi:transposase-like protein
LAGKHAQYKPAFRNRIAKLIVESNRSIAEVAREYGLDETIVGGWATKYRSAHAIDEAPGGIVSDARAKLREAELLDRYAQAINHLDHERWQQAANLLAAIEQEQPGYRDTVGLLMTARRKRREAVEASRRPAPSPRRPATVEERGQTRRLRVAALVVIVVAFVGGLIILALLQSSSSSNISSPSTSTSPSISTSMSMSTSRATTPAPSTRRIASAQALGPNETVADYINKNNIQETTISHATPGAPTVDFPVPAGWTVIPEGAGAPYGGFVFNTPTNPGDPAKIIAIVEKLTGNVDTDKLWADSPGEVKNLPGYSGGHGHKSSLSGCPAYLIGGMYTKNGVTRMVAQKTVVIQGKDGIYVLQLNAEGPQADANALESATDVIDQKTKITR